jgi:hypothetical protein
MYYSSVVSNLFKITGWHNLFEKCDRPVNVISCPSGMMVIRCEQTNQLLASVCGINIILFKLLKCLMSLFLIRNVSLMLNQYISNLFRVHAQLNN